MFNSVRLIPIVRMADERGSLCFLENGQNLPFDIARCFWISEVPTGSIRGDHAHRTCSELLIATHGSFDVDVFDGIEWTTYKLNKSDQALFIAPYIWCRLYNFSEDAVCLCLASHAYDPSGYINDMEEFEKEVSKLS